MESKTPDPDEAAQTQPVGDWLPYASAAAFHDAIKARLKSAAEVGPYDINQLRRQFAYDRLLTRVFEHAPEKWVLKGGTGLLARIPQHARHTKDVDLHYQGEATAAASDLFDAVALDLGDFFSFDLDETGDLTGVNPGSKTKIVVYIGDTRFSNFEIDTVVASNMTAIPELVDALTPITIEGLHVNQYRAYPMVDHVADKHAAMVARYSDGHPSTRYRDLVDIVIIATSQHIEAAALHKALMSEYRHRDLKTQQKSSFPPTTGSTATRYKRTMSPFSTTKPPTKECRSPVRSSTRSSKVATRADGILSRSNGVTNGSNRRDRDGAPGRAQDAFH